MTKNKTEIFKTSLAIKKQDTKKSSYGQTSLKVNMPFVWQSQLRTTQRNFFLQRQILMQDILISLQNQIILRILKKAGNILLDISLRNTKKRHRKQLKECYLDQPERPWYCQPMTWKLLVLMVKFSLLLGHFQSILHKREWDKETIIQVYERMLIMTYQQ